MGAVAIAFDDAFQVVGDVSKAAAAALGAIIDAAIASAVADSVGGGGFVALHSDVSRSETAAVVTGTNLYVRRSPRPLDIADLRASVTSPTTTGAITVDLKVNGSSILTTPVQIDAGQKTSVGSSAPFAINPADVIIPDNAEIEISVTGQGDGTAKGLKFDIITSGTTVGELNMPTFVAAGLRSGSANASVLAVPYPVGYVGVANDVAIMIAGGGLNTGAPIRPSGWSTIDTIGNVTLYWKRLVGGESGNVALNFTGLDDICAKISIWRNCVQMGNPYEAETPNTGTSTTVENGQVVVTAGPDRRVVTFYWDYLGHSLGTIDGSSSPDVGWTEVYDENFSATACFQLACSAQAVLVGASIAAETRTLAHSAVTWSSFSLALVPGT